MRVTNSLVQKEKKTFSQAITGDSLQNLIKKSVASPEAAARFTGTLISAVASTPQLQNCTPATVVAAALRGEGMGLTLNREYHLIPFASSCAFVIGYRGLISLCLAGNDVADMDCVEVREGEWVGRDKRTKRPVFDFSVYKTDEEAAAHKTIGWMAYVEMRDGYFRSEYMSINDILNHAERYSKAFSIEKYRKMESGKMSPDEEEKLKQGSPWYSNFPDMARKTVLRKLLNSGFVRLANSAAVRDAINYDYGVDNNIIPDLDIPDNTIEADAEVHDAPQDAPEAADKVEAEVVTDNTTGKPKRGRRAPERVRSEDKIPHNAVADFFGEDVAN
jgi:recombination protein RecT